ncbi:Kef-type K+ transport system, predicted NAD-binding component [Rubidibacter lacunae KORDI 51-2]|uniref:Kef-type K+ transport system, predicted NAD-binding component n=1 Tax=Rubidibacter lacunae KORDI 51-2 TaxID=582515 RepID=U5D705_9CHRO|nr:cation:proton antiporter [Rubidibacter lacunae]ERN40433.1 Kef-type K+ transport system, predicted NAD-binding component [Rubidibacter lacunae KORDI 51-2]
MASVSSELTLIFDMVTVLGSATIAGYVANRLGQPVLLGYLIGGIVVGPAGLHWVVDEEEVQVLAEVGVALLLFALGVEFSLKELLRMRKIALGGGTLQIFLTIMLGGALAYGTGWVSTIPKAIFLGSVLSLSSTAVVLKSLIERNEVQTVHGQIMLALLVVQDLSLGLMLAILPALTQPPEVLGQALLVAALKVLLFIIGALVTGKYVIPWLVRQLALSGSQEIFLLGILVICLGIALLSDRLGLGIAMGAFVAGLTISNVEYADHALDLVLPMRDVFATLFFASIGLLIDPLFLWQNAWIVAGLVAIAMVGKASLVASIVRLFGYPLKTALVVGLGVNQIGEFSFVLAGVARSQELFSSNLYNLALGTTAATLLITPFSLKLTPYLIQYLERLPQLNRWFNLNPEPYSFGLEENLRNHVVVVGYGRVGRTLVRMFYFQRYPILVIDNNEAVLQHLRERQIPYLFGDASSSLVLEKAQLSEAMAMAIALPDPVATRLTLNRALSIAPDLDITVRAHLKDEIESLYQLGAQEVVQPEFEAALEMGAHMLLQLGDSAYAVQQVVQRYRTGHYREILPERAEYWNLKELELAIEGLHHEWYNVTPDSLLAGVTLGAANIRRRTGATIMAIDRHKRFYQYPTGEIDLEAGDRLLVVGSPEEHQNFLKILRQ